MTFDAVRAAKAIVRDAQAAPVANDALTRVEGVVLSVDRGIVVLRDTVVGGTRRLIAPPLIAEVLKRSSGSVALLVDAGGHVVTHIT